MIEVVRPESIGLCSTRLQRIDHWLQQQIDAQRLAGASVLIGRRGAAGYLGQAGVREIGSAAAFDAETVVRIYSMTKPVTSVAAMMLYEQGCFQLDDPVALYLPEFANMQVWSSGAIDNTVAADQPITIKHLLTHTAGLTYGFMQANPVDARYRKEQIEFPGRGGTLAAMVTRLADIPLIAQPGSAWNYSVATDVLGRLVEVWSGCSLANYFATNILQPLGMHETAFRVADNLRDRFAACYTPLRGGGMASVAASNPSDDASQRGGLKLMDSGADSRFLDANELYSGGGGLTSTIGDYARFCQMLLNGGTLAGQRLLSPTTVHYMRQNHLPDNRDMAAMGQPQWSETSYDGIGFGLGFAVVLDPVKAQIITSPGEHHWGGAASTFFWVDPVQDLYCIFLTQLMPSSTYPVRRELRTRVYQAIIDL
ncbi:MAG: serine hydrolase domain-containing protein [Pseudomonadales bacterium]